MCGRASPYTVFASCKFCAGMVHIPLQKHETPPVHLGAATSAWV